MIREHFLLSEVKKEVYLFLCINTYIFTIRNALLHIVLQKEAYKLMRLDIVP